MRHYLFSVRISIARLFMCAQCFLGSDPPVLWIEVQVLSSFCGAGLAHSSSCPVFVGLL
jgi:hypothetical protein